MQLRRLQRMHTAAGSTSTDAMHQNWMHHERCQQHLMQSSLAVEPLQCCEAADQEATYHESCLVAHRLTGSTTTEGLNGFKAQVCG